MEKELSNKALSRKVYRLPRMAKLQSWQITVVGDFGLFAPGLVEG